MNFDLYSIVTIFLVLTAGFSYINVRFIRLPATIGIMLISLACSILLLVIGKFNPQIIDGPAKVISTLDFESLLMRFMLSLLLFAGAIHIDIQKFRRELPAIIAYSTLGVIISTAVVGYAMYAVLQAMNVPVNIIYCLLFGALISPTDPIAVIGILKKARIPQTIETKIAGESLFNDGVGVVVFISLLEVSRTGIENISFWQVAGLFGKEAGGGILFGLAIGYIGFYLRRSINHYQVEVLITLALVMGGYLLANWVHISGPLSIVAAGIVIGNKGQREAMSDLTKDYVNKFWELIDEILNALLFLLIGFELVILSFDKVAIGAGISGIVIVLVARLISVWLPSTLLFYRRGIEPHLVPILTWGGLRGGISVALALSLPKTEHRSLFISITYIVVIFSIVVQGLTIGKLAKRLISKDKLITPVSKN